MIAVLDPNIIISALLSPTGPPARVLKLWLEGVFGLVCSQALLDELGAAFAYPKLRSRISGDEAREVIELISRGAILLEDPVDPPSVVPMIPATTI